MTEYKHLRNRLTVGDIAEKHVWPRGGPRLLLLALILVNLWSCYTVRSDHPLLAIGHAAMALVLLLVFVFAGRGKVRQLPRGSSEGKG